MKYWKCPDCKRTAKSTDNIIMFICRGCGEGMEYVERVARSYPSVRIGDYIINKLKGGKIKDNGS